MRFDAEDSEAAYVNCVACENANFGGKWFARSRQRERTGKITDYYCVSSQFLDLAKKAKVRWIHDGPRHSFVSYRLALLGDIARVSEETGTNATTLREHYRRPVAKEEAERYFGIVP